MYIRFENFMGDRDDHAEVNLIGPFPDAGARARELARLEALPLGASEFNGGYLFHADTDSPAGADRVVEPATVAAATTIRESFAAFFGYEDDDQDDDEVHPDQAALVLLLPEPTGIAGRADDEPTLVTGVLSEVEIQTTRQGRDWLTAVLTCEDGQVPLRVFPRPYPALAGELTEGATVRLVGRVDRRNDGPVLVVLGRIQDAVVADPGTNGFIERAGLFVTPIGDDGDVLLALGHHEPAAAVAAFQGLAEYLGWDALDAGNGDVADGLERRWASFTPASEHAGSEWWCDYSAKDEAPGLTPVTVLDWS